MKSGLEFALSQRSWAAPTDVELDIHREVLNKLAAVEPDESVFVVRRLVDAAVARALRPWSEGKEKRKAAEQAIDRLPLEVRRYSPWKERVRRVRAGLGSVLIEPWARLWLVGNWRHRADLDFLHSVLKAALRLDIDNNFQADSGVPAIFGRLLARNRLPLPH